MRWPLILQFEAVHCCWSSCVGHPRTRGDYTKQPSARLQGPRQGSYCIALVGSPESSCGEPQPQVGLAAAECHSATCRAGAGQSGPGLEFIPEAAAHEKEGQVLGSNFSDEEVSCSFCRAPAPDVNTLYSRTLPSDLPRTHLLIRTLEPLNSQGHLRPRKGVLRQVSHCQGPLQGLRGAMEPVLAGPG